MAGVKCNVVERDGVDLGEKEEISPSSDSLQAAGIYFQGSADHVIERVGGLIKVTIPDSSSKPTYDGSHNLTAFEIFTTTTQTTVNRRLRGDYTYTGDNLTTEEYKIYDESDGTTVLRTITVTHTYDGNNFLTDTTVVET